MIRARFVVFLVALVLPSLAAAQGSVGEALHRLTEIEDHRDHLDPFVEQALSHTNPRVVEKALTAIGRIGHPDQLGAATGMLSHRFGRVRAAAAFATGLIGGEGAEDALTQRLQRERRPDVKRELLMALGRVGGESTVAVLAAHLGAHSSLVRASAAQALGLLFNKRQSSGWSVPAEVEEELLQLARSFGRTAVAAAFALSRYRAPVGAVEQATYVAVLQRSHHPEARALLWRRLSRFDSEEVARALQLHITADAHEGVRVEAARALGRQTCNAATLTSAQAGLADTSSQVVAATLGSVSSWGDCARALRSQLDARFRGDVVWLAAEALQTLLNILPADEAEALAVGETNSDVPAIAGVAIRSLPAFAGAHVVERLAELASSDDLLRRRAAAEAIAYLDPARATPAIRRALQITLASGDQAPVYYATVAVQNFAYSDLIPDLRATYQGPWQEDEYSVKVGVLDSIAVLGDAGVIDIIEAGLADTNTQVNAAADQAHRAIFGEPGIDAIPVNHRVEGETPPPHLLRRATRSIVRIETVKGSFILGMVPEAALTAHRFVSLVSEGFYDGLTFHRIVPNFVAQGGDPRGDGWGGPGPFIRDEVGRRRHERGTVGIATSGKDTGGCQIFVNHAPNLHLDGRYTIFARVLFGMEVVDRLEQTDRIVRATVLWP